MPQLCYKDWFPTFTPKCTLMITGGLFSEIRLDYDPLTMIFARVRDAQTKYSEAISSSSIWKLLWFEIIKMLIAVLKINVLCYLL